MVDEGLCVHVLRITAEAREPIELEEHPGSALRGALFGALLRRFCINPSARTCAECPLNATCPVAALVAPLRDESPRGRDVPRPFVLAPSPAYVSRPAKRVEPGEVLSFDVSLVGQMAAYFPYIGLSMPMLESQGLGRKLAALGGRRGRLHVLRIESVDPFGEETRTLYMRGQSKVAAPALPITGERVAQRAAALPAERVMVRFLTPTRLVAEGKLVRWPEFRVLALRLAERVLALAREYGQGVGDEAEQMAWYRGIERMASGVRLACDETRWVDVASYSARQRRATPIGGFLGPAVFEGHLAPLRELLVWGEILHVGKNAVKGDGLYRIEA